MSDFVPGVLRLHFYDVLAHESLSIAIDHEKSMDHGIQRIRYVCPTLEDAARYPKLAADMAKAALATDDDINDRQAWYELIEQIDSLAHGFRELIPMVQVAMEEFRGKDI